MKVVFVPPRLRLATGLLLLLIPLAVAESLLASRLSWWKLGLQDIRIWAGIGALAAIPLGYWISRGSRLAFYLLAAIGLSWSFCISKLAIEMKNPNLGFFALLVISIWSFLWFWIRYEVGRSYFDPQIRWYQGLPKAIPALKCWITQGEQREEHQVARLDLDGAFIFSETCNSHCQLRNLRRGFKAELTFCFRDRQVKCVGVPVRLLKKKSGAGFQFLRMSPDLQKEIGDFVETLRGEGYVG